MGDPARADRALRADVDAVAQVVSLRSARGRAAAAELLELLEEADRRLTARLRREVERGFSGTDRFTGASAAAYREQIRIVLRYVQGRLGGLTATQAAAAVAESVDRTGRLLEQLERDFTGITRPLRIRQAEVMSRIRHGTRASLLAQHATSVDRYGEAMQRVFEREIRTGLLEGASLDEMTDRLVGHGGPRGTVSLAARVVGGIVVRTREEEIPEGLFTRYRYWAERIVRTEVAHAYQAAKLATLLESRARDFPDLQKKILATLDNRTAADSIAVHGQIRDLDGPNSFFMDGAGRQYQRPPARPNDRETLTPWRPHWPETPFSRPLSTAEREAAIEGNVRLVAAQRVQMARADRPRGDPARVQRRLALAAQGAVERREAAARRRRRRG